jgi:hypothetical protein
VSIGSMVGAQFIWCSARLTSSGFNAGLKQFWLFHASAPVQMPTTLSL